VVKKAFILTLVTVLMLSNFGCKKSTSPGKVEIGEKEIVVTEAEMRELLSDIKAKFKKLRPQVIQPAEGYLKYPYLIPAGFYKQMWDWDGFFIGNHLASIGKPEYLKYWALNLIEGIDTDGYVSGCATTKGPRPIFGKFAMKPFLSQGVYFASMKLGDFSWIEEHYQDLMKVLAYREKTQQDEKTGLFFWEIAMQSGADNNVAMNYFKEDTRSFLSCDASTLQLREYLAQAGIAERLGKQEDVINLRDKAATLQVAINRILWCPEDNIYYNVDRETGEFYKRISYSCFLPLIQKLAPQARGTEMIRRFLINIDHMKGKFGLRTLSIQDPDYNNKNVIKPFSNWQGPVWPIANYLYSLALRHYGFEEDLRWQAFTLGKLVSADIEKWGSMHENYHADTGAPLAPAETYVDKNGKFVGFISWNLCIQNMLEGVVENNWMLLEIE
jgi:alpha,alpha-trehalase